MILKSIVFILGTPYCGSTVLANLLSEYHSVFNIGELDRIDGLGTNENPIHSGWCEICTISGQSCPVFSDSLIEQIKTAPSHFDRYQFFSQLNAKSVLLDGSKHASWLNAVSIETNVRNIARPVILVRHPVSFILSSQRRHAEFNRPSWKWCEIWRDTYFDLLRSCSRNGLPYLIIRYEDFCAMPDKTMQVIRQYSDIGDVKLATKQTPAHYIGGNSALNVRLKAGVTLAVDPNIINYNSEEYQMIKNDLFNTPGCFDLYHNIFGYL